MSRIKLQGSDASSQQWKSAADSFLRTAACAALKCGPDDELVLLKVPAHVADEVATLEGARVPVDGALNVSGTSVQVQGQAYRLHQVHEDATSRLVLFVAGSEDGAIVPSALPVTRMLELVTYADDSAGNAQRLKVLKDLSAGPRKDPPLRQASAAQSPRGAFPVRRDAEKEQGSKQQESQEQKKSKKKKKKKKEKEKTHKEQKGEGGEAQRSAKKPKHG
jgi:hypothetical protein